MTTQAETDVAQGFLTWDQIAACRNSEPDMFFPKALRGRGGKRELLRGAAKAIEICETCLVRRQCLDYALRHNVTCGVWGGQLVGPT